MTFRFGSAPVDPVPNVFRHNSINFSVVYGFTPLEVIALEALGTTAGGCCGIRFRETRGGRSSDIFGMCHLQSRRFSLGKDFRKIKRSTTVSKFQSALNRLYCKIHQADYKGLTFPSRSLDVMVCFSDVLCLP